MALQGITKNGYVAQAEFEFDTLALTNDNNFSPGL